MCYLFETRSFKFFFKVKLLLAAPIKLKIKNIRKIIKLLANMDKF